MKSFAVYIEHGGAVGCLDDAMAGRLFKALFAYAADGTEPEWDDKALTAVFMMFRSQVDRNAEAYQEKCAKSAANASRRASPPAGKATASGTIPAQAADSDRLPDTADASDGIPTTKDLLYKILELQTCRIEDDKRLSEKEQRK